MKYDFVRGLLLAGLLPGLASAADLYRLPIGDAGRSDRVITVGLDAVTDTATGEQIPPAELARRLAGVDILFVGENHTNEDFHAVQFHAIRALHEAGREVHIGLEMFPWTEQAHLDRWNDGLYTEAGFVEVADWYGNWGYHWNYYRDIFLYARRHGLPMHAVNAPRELVRKIRQDGFESLDEEEAAGFPPRPAPASEEHRRMYRAFFDEDDALHMSESALEGLYRAQTAWDATMGWNALKALEAHGGEEAIMIVLIGAGHATYGLGSERQIRPWTDRGIASLIPVPVSVRDGTPVREVQASFASFIWGVPPEREPAYPTLGVSLMGSIGREPGQVIQVSPGSVADRAGLAVGDIVVAVAGKSLRSDADLRRAMHPYRWGDSLPLTVRTDGAETAVQVELRRPPQPREEAPASR